VKILFILNRKPYDDTDMTWNGLRLAAQLLEDECEVRIFLMNDAVDMALDVCQPPKGRSGQDPCLCRARHKHGSWPDLIKRSIS
jgi:sulfur relay (sulfurtransferase) complex TusBCD TusD component (DsrE family)